MAMGFDLEKSVDSLFDLEQVGVPQGTLLGQAAYMSFADLAPMVQGVKAGLEAAGVRMVVASSAPMVLDGLPPDELVKIIADSGSRFATISRDVFDFERFFETVGRLQEGYPFAGEAISAMRNYAGRDESVLIGWFEGGNHVAARVGADWIEAMGGLPVDIAKRLREVHDSVFMEAYDTEVSLLELLELRSRELGAAVESDPRYRSVRNGRSQIASEILPGLLTQKEKPFAGSLIRMAMSHASSLWNVNRERAFSDVDVSEIAARVSAEDAKWLESNIRMQKLIIKRALSAECGGYPPTEDETAAMLHALRSVEPQG